MAVLRFGGQGDRNLVILHATGFLAAAYQPLADALSRNFVVWGLDLPGHGTAVDALLPLPSSSSSSSEDQPHAASSSSGLIPITMPGLAQYVIDALSHAGLEGCYAFAHSAGGAVALQAACQCPQLFRALYCYEAVVATPATHAFMAAAARSRSIVTDGQLLGTLARKRRAAFSSRAAALQHLTAKPPFSRMHPAAVEQYVQHGLVPAAQGCCADAAQAPAHQQQQQQQQQQQWEQPVRLLCSPEQEAAYYDALRFPPAIDPHRISCPVLLAVAAPPAGSGVTPTAALATHQGVRDWFHRKTLAVAASSSSSRSGSSANNQELHGELRVLNIELAAAMPTARLLEVQVVTHFGPLEQPQALADSCTEFFLGERQRQQFQQQQLLQPAASKL